MEHLRTRTREATIMDQDGGASVKSGLNPNPICLHVGMSMCVYACMPYNHMSACL